jgi:hypothetical protein
MTLFLGRNGVIYKEDILRTCAFDDSVPTEEELHQSIVTERDIDMDFVEIKKEKVASSGLTKGWVPCLIVIPLRLGLEALNPVYIPSLLTFFSFPQSVGIVGGRKNHSLWFVACQVCVWEREKGGEEERETQSQVSDLTRNSVSFPFDSLWVDRIRRCFITIPIV